MIAGVATQQNRASSPVPSAELQNSFDNLAVLRPAAVNTLDANMRGGKAYAAKVESLTGQLSAANDKFAEAWQSLIIEVPGQKGKRISVFSPVLDVLVNFFKDNGSDRDSLLNYIAKGYFKFDVQGLVTEVEYEKIADPFIVRSLKGLNSLKTLSLSDAPSNPAEIAELTFLESLDLCSRDLSNIPTLRNIKLKELTWQYYHSMSSKDKHTSKLSLDLTPFSCVESLESLEISRDRNQSVWICLRGLAALTKMPFLRKFGIWGACLEDRFPEVDIPQIKHLNIHQSEIKDLSLLDCFSSLEGLRISNCKLLCQSLKYPASLSSLGLCWNRDVSDFAALLRPLLDLKLKSFKFYVRDYEHVSCEAREILSELSKNTQVECFPTLDSLLSGGFVVKENTPQASASSSSINGKKET